jgi:hypothetical protein
MNKTLADFYLLRVVHHWVDNEWFPRTAHIRQFDSADEGRQYDGLAETMNDNQKAVFRTITQAIESSPSTAHFFLEGAGGTGKTYLYRVLSSYYRSRPYRDDNNNETPKYVICVAFTGIAGLLLPGGQTAHSFFAVPLNAALGTRLSASSEQARLIRDTQLIIWDEVPMQNKEVVEAVDKCLQDIIRVNSHFSGIPMVLGGNWAQILLVVPGGSQGAIVNACLQQSYIWPHLQKFFLQQNMPAIGPGSGPYIEWLWRMSSSPELFGTLELPQFFIVVQRLNDLLFSVFPRDQLIPADNNHQWFAKQAILLPLNE